MSIQWFPGHMQKARRQMEEQLKLVDIIIELRDARIPNASANPILQQLAPNKPRLIILNKADLADEDVNKGWLKSFEHCLLLNSTSDNLSKIVVNEVKEILKDKLEKAKARGIRKKVLRAMVVGIPNVGKSTFINNIVKKKATKVENRPGVTRSLQWIKINEDVELLDTPGVLWPKFDNQEDAKLLALVGSINDDVINDLNELVNFGLKYLVNNYPGLLNKRYDIDESKDDLLNQIAKAKSWLSKDNEIDEAKAIASVLKDIRSGAIGRITWQKC